MLLRTADSNDVAPNKLTKALWKQSNVFVLINIFEINILITYTKLFRHNMGEHNKITSIRLFDPHPIGSK